MRYVGASNWTIRLPFILEGTIASLIGSVLSCLMLSAIVNVFVTGWLAKSVTWIPYVNQLTVLVNIAVPGCGRDTAVHHRFNHLVAALFEGVTRPAYPREM